MKKKLDKLQTGSEAQSRDGFSSSTSQTTSRGQWERRLQSDIHMAKKALSEALSPEKPTSTLSDLKPSIKAVQATTYASSTENIARLLKNWTRNPTKLARKNSITTDQSYSFYDKMGSTGTNDSTSSEGTDQQLSAANNNNEGELCEALESLFGSFECFESSNSDFSGSVSPDASLFQVESKPDPNFQLPLSLLEKWLFDEGATQGKEHCLNDVNLDDHIGNFFS